MDNSEQRIGTERIVRELTFSRRRDDEGNWQTILKEDDEKFIPIADVEPPEYINGFEQIKFDYIDDQILQFMENILPLLNEVKIHVPEYVRFGNPQICLVEMLASKTNKLEIYENRWYDLNQFNQQFPNFITGLQSICLQNVSMGTYMDLAVKWLTTPPREDGKPKMLEIQFDYYHSYDNMVHLIKCVKEEFIRSTESANFIICMHGKRLYGYEDFKIENEATEEMLEFQWKEPNKYFLVRHKNDTETTAKVDDLEKQFERKEETTIWIK